VYVYVCIHIKLRMRFQAQRLALLAVPGSRNYSLTRIPYIYSIDTYGSTVVRIRTIIMFFMRCMGARTVRGVN
jgi:hypothetical protein